MSKPKTKGTWKQKHVYTRDGAHRSIIVMVWERVEGHKLGRRTVKESKRNRRGGF